MFERKIVKVYRPVKGENWRIRAHKEIKRHSRRGRGEVCTGF
jgi:hypothetical protein